MLSEKQEGPISEPGGEAEPLIKGSEAAPYLYVDDFWDASWGGGIVKFRLVRLRRSDGPVERDFWEVVAILAMSARNLIEVHKFIGTIIEQMKELETNSEES